MSDHSHYHNVNTELRLTEFIESLEDQQGQVVAFDLETTGLDARAKGASIVSLSVTYEDEETYVLPLDHPDSPWGYKWETVAKMVARRLQDTLLVAHNANFDIDWMFVHTGFDLSESLYWDTQSAAHLLNENQSKGLKSLASMLVPKWGIDIRRAKEVDWFTLAQYNAWDTIATMRLFETQRGPLREDSSLGDLHRRVVVPQQRTLSRIKARGIHLDRGAARAALTRAEAEAESAKQELVRIGEERYGLDFSKFPTFSLAGTSKMFLALMDAAGKAGDVYVMEYTSKGRPSWRAGVLNDLSREGYEVASLVLSYRHGEKQAQFLRSWLKESRRTGRVHANFNNARAVTGRLTSSDPNMQQVSRELKSVFGPSEGLMFAELDWSQIEMRVAAEYIHRTVLPDNPMKQAFEEGLDLHSMAATLVTGGEAEDVSKEDRQKGKAVNFGFIFGMGYRAFVQYAREVYGVEFTLEEAAKVRADYFNLWKGLGEWHQFQRELVAEQGYVETLFGRRRRLPAIFTGDEYERGEAERQAINSPVQGTAADLMALGLVEMEKVDNLFLVGTVHDSALAEVPSVSVAEQAACKMLLGGVTFSTPLEVEVSVGPRWNEYTDTITRSTHT